MGSSTLTRRAHRGRAPWRLLVAVPALVAAACTGAPAEVVVDIDGGTAQVALLGDTVVAADPGASVTIRHATRPASGAEAPLTHALVAADPDDLPPVFDRGGGGVVPNPAVWGPCRGGDVAAATGQCPVAAVDGPQAWDGTTYWSLGAMLPGESRELPLSPDIDDGDHTLVCALHPELRVVVRVGGEAPAGDTGDAGAQVDAAWQAATRGPVGGGFPVTAGTTVDTPPAYVAAFSPDPVRIGVGDTVTWRAGGRAPVDVVFGGEGDHLSLSHTAPEDGLPDGAASAWDGRDQLRSGFLSADSTAGAVAGEWTVTFTRPGTFRYASRFSDQMTGTVVVEREAE